MTEWDSFLEGVARKHNFVYTNTCERGSPGFYFCLCGWEGPDRASYWEHVVIDLRSRLLPLLEAGEDLRSGIYTGTEKVLRDQAWDSAKEAALKENK